MTESEARELFAKIDSDSDGRSISSNSPTTYKSEGHTGQLKGKVKEALAADANRDRVLDFDEFHALVK
ncbi:hypothetical protein EDE04_7421 [Streptomyces sp. 2132.2]|uniref:hypothetical protein n=1 Tax=Streptomyces sp. 2132.2 TaxID=2485161 RepID=UPI000F4A945A|nr:hypothetical protein [Streptomyces sp. 2132.2]ROQ89023.1 hypothetical protein EDE04_7421 [Streptomyces sp. 2132.2]